MVGRILMYGANGYTGRLAVRAARQMQLRPILAGRNPALVKSVADTHTFDWRGFSLDDPDEIDRNLQDVGVVLHMAGPFSATARPMVEACLRTRTHYLDITGEIAVIEDLASLFAEAQRQGIMIVPGVGFDVVPSDCLLGHLMDRLPAARTLTLAIQGLDSYSRGTAKTAIESLGEGTLIRRDGRIVSLETPPMREFDFGDGPVPCYAVSWGDIASAHHSTGVPNIQVYFAATKELERMVKAPPWMRWAFRQPLVRRQLVKRIAKGPDGPSREERERGRVRLIAFAEDKTGLRVGSMLETPEAYALTAQVAVDIAAQIADGAVQPGFHTPCTFLGPDYILRAEGVERIDLDL